MLRSSDEISDVLAMSFVSFMTLAKHSLSPTQTKIATERAGNCLWALGIGEHSGFQAVAPDPIGETIDGEATLLVQSSQSKRGAP
ncbi:MAG: hypothetical protein GYB53_11470 [Rhodobacteraceae bacterium]|nr:hypothetical protein [Paracoccaceae bacterium]MBR9820749.1 hypothetical protein [Paracoccaceae bacterium]